MTTRTTSAAAVPIATIFSLNTGLVPRALDGVAPEHLWKAPTDRNNPMLWIVGHVVETRARVLGLLGEKYETGWGNVFNRGTTLGESERYPSRDEIVRVLGEVTVRLEKVVASLDDERLAGPKVGMNQPFATTLAEQLAFFAMHDAYHVGQLAYIRKALGYPQLVG